MRTDEDDCGWDEVAAVQFCQEINRPFSTFLPDPKSDFALLFWGKAGIVKDGEAIIGGSCG